MLRFPLRANHGDPTHAMTKQVFISHSSKDEGKARAVCELLEQAQIGCWMAPRDVEGGALWGERIVSALEQCYAVVVLLSSSANSSDQVHNEIHMALKNGKVVVPFRVEQFQLSGELKLLLQRRHWLEASDGPFEAHLAGLLATVRAVLSAAPVKTSAFEPKQPHPMTPNANALSPRAKRSVRLGMAAGLLGVVLIGLMVARPWRSRRRPHDAAPVSDVTCGTFSRHDVVLSPEGRFRQFRICDGRYYLQRIDSRNPADNECQIVIYRSDSRSVVAQSKVLAAGADRPQRWTGTLPLRHGSITLVLKSATRASCIVDVDVANR
jgi:TIR domain-containing protein